MPFSLQPSAFCLLIALIFALPACSPDKPAQASLQLQVISPHGSDIRREFGDAFSTWHQQHFGQGVEVIWPDIGGGGTGNIVRQLEAAYKYRDSSGYDVMFGGGSVAFSTFERRGFLVGLPPATEEELRRAGWSRDPVGAVPEKVFESPLHGEGGRWVAATMSTFGIEINRDRIAELQLREPSKWEDIAGAAWMGRLSLADPTKSGSVKTSYEMILQQHGWEEGWGVLMRLFANAAMIRESGAYPADDAASAEAVAGIVIDFYGRLQVSRVGPRVAGFVVPEGGTALDADPIGMLKGAPHGELAARFVRFVVSAEGQRLWVNRAGTPGGPRKTALGRMAVLPEVYRMEAANLFDGRNPFEGGTMLRFDKKIAAQRNGFLGDLIKTALIDNHAGLVRARQAIRAAGDPPDLLAQLIAPPEYQPARVESGALIYGDLKVVDGPELEALSRHYAPPTGDALAAFGERLQNGLKEGWRAGFAARYADVEKAARTRNGP